MLFRSLVEAIRVRRSEPRRNDGNRRTLMASTSAPASACRVAPGRATDSRLLHARSLVGGRAVVWRCWGARRGRRGRWAGLRARCGIGGAGVQPAAVQPGSESAEQGLVAEDGPTRWPFDLNLAVVLAGFAFEAYTSPPVSPLSFHS